MLGCLWLGHLARRQDVG